MIVGERCAETSRHCLTLNPPATGEEIRAASVQFVRKLSGFTKPSKVNEAVFAVEDVSKVAHELLDSLVTTAAFRNREEEVAKARARAEKRFGKARSA